MKEKKIVLNPEERKQKLEQIEEYDMAIEGTELNIPILEREIELNLPSRRAMIQAKKQLAQMKLNVSNYKKEKTIIEDQLKNWK